MQIAPKCFYKSPKNSLCPLTHLQNNKLSAIIEKLHEKAAKNTLVGSEIIYLIDWIEQINKLQNSGVHSEITREQAMRCIIHTYIALGDILKLKESVK